MPKRKKRKPSLCKNTKNGRCDGTYVIEYEQEAPVFVCEKCQHKDSTWLKFHKEYLLLYKDNNNWAQDRHKISCVLGLFNSLYKKMYKTDYVFVPQNPNPYSSKEAKDSAKLLAAFQNNAVDAGKYLVWCFKEGVSSRAKVISFAYFLTPALIRRFKLLQQESKKISRSTILPKNFLTQCRKEIPNIFELYELKSVGDLSLIAKTIDSYDLGDESSEKKVIDLAISCGINIKGVGEKK